MKHITLASLCVCLLASTVLAQQFSPPPRGPASLLYVRFLGAPGMKVTFYRDRSGPREFDLPATVGLRPGYIYRVKVSGIPDRPGLALYPTLEVRGSLCLPPKLQPSDHPAPVTITETDIARVLDNVFLTKVVYLEHPDKAAPSATRPDQPLETTLPVNRDLVESAREFGRPMVIVRMGERPMEDSELLREAIAGTVLLPGEKGLLPPQAAPTIPYACFPFYDPIAGPKPLDEECLHDGGDIGRPAGIGPDGRAGGLDPSDTLAEYTDEKGRRRLVKSNRVCLCVPRFALLRSELPLAAYERRVELDDRKFVMGQVEVGTHIPSLLTEQRKHLNQLHMRVRPSGATGETGVGSLLRLEILDAYEMMQGPETRLCLKPIQELRQDERVELVRRMTFAQSFIKRTNVGQVEQAVVTSVVGRVEGLKEVSATLETDDLTILCKEHPEVLMGKPLHLIKWADRDSGQIGDVVTFFLKFSNHGGKPISEVAVSDSLTGRLEYIPGSARSDRNAVFTMQHNEAGSLILRWEVSGRLLPGQSGVVQFQARIR